MSHLSQSLQPPNLQKRDSIFSHHSIPNLNTPQSVEPSQQDQQVPSFQFIESVPTTMMKNSFKFTAGGETTPSMSMFPNDCDLKYYKSTTSSNGPFLIRDNDENQMSHRTASLNLVADTVSMNNIDEQKSTAKFGPPQRVFFQLNNESYIHQDDQEDLRDSMCPSGGSRRLLTDQTPSERQAGEGKQNTLDGGFTKNYRQLNEEKDISSGSCSDNRTSTRYIKEKINLFPIVEDENGSPVHARTPNANGNQRNPHQTPNRRPTGHGNTHRSDNSPQEIALNLFPDAIQNSPQNSLSPQFLIRREDALSPNSGNIQLVNPWEAPVDREDAQVTLETKLYMKRMLAVYATVSLFSLFLYLAVNNHMSFQALFGIILGYLVYYAIENIVRTCYFQRETWRDTEDVYNTLDAFCGIIFLALAQLKYSKLVSVSMISFIPFLATTGAYYMFAKSPRIVKNGKTLLRCFYTLQVFMITAKLDKVFDWDWRIIIGLTWICIGVIGIRSTVLTISQILKLVSNKLRRRTRQNTTTLLIEFTGAIWKLFCYILYIVGFIALFGCSQAFLASEKEFDLLKLSAIIGFGLTVALILYTLILFKPLLQYLKKFQRFYTSPARQSQPQPVLKKQSTINLEVEKHHKSYFVMLSPTYFLPLKNGFIAKKEENIKRIKKMLYSLRVWKSKKPHAGTVASPKAANIEELKQDKDVLDEKFTKLANMNVNINEVGDGMPKGPRSTRPRAPTSIFIEHLTGFFSKEKESLSTLGGMDTGRKQNLSADDLHFNKFTLQKTGKAHSEENLCYLCFDNVPNAVLMGCGHGGICYDCANELVKKKNECMECRSSVEAIYKVDANLKVCDIIKGVELTKVCVSP